MFIGIGIGKPCPSPLPLNHAPDFKLLSQRSFLMTLSPQMPIYSVALLSYKLLTLGAHAHEGYGSLFVCLSVCYQSTDCIRHLHNKMNVPANFAPNSKGFQLTDFAKILKLSLTSYSLFFIFSIAKSAIFHSQYRKLGLNPLRILLVVMPITIYGYRVQFIGQAKLNCIIRSCHVAVLLQCLILKCSPFILNLGLRLDHSFNDGLILELSDSLLHTYSHHPVIAL